MDLWTFCGLSCRKLYTLLQLIANPVVAASLDRSGAISTMQMQLVLQPESEYDSEDK
jgi:hypothetical protein